jgi:hypothetical protein
MKTNETKTKTNRATTWRLPILGALLVSTSISMLVGSRSAQGATSCNLGETVYMTTPVVIVIEGAGDAATEQAQWSALEFAGLRGGPEMGLGERTWELEPVP